MQEDCVRKLAEVQVREENFDNFDFDLLMALLSVVKLSHSSWYSNGAGWCSGVSCRWKYGI